MDRRRRKNMDKVWIVEALSLEPISQVVKICSSLDDALDERRKYCDETECDIDTVKVYAMETPAPPGALDEVVEASDAEKLVLRLIKAAKWKELAGVVEAAKAVNLSAQRTEYPDYTVHKDAIEALRAALQRLKGESPVAAENKAAALRGQDLTELARTADLIDKEGME
jgi:hypothetical protein